MASARETGSCYQQRRQLNKKNWLGTHIFKIFFNFYIFFAVVQSFAAYGSTLTLPKSTDGCKTDSFLTEHRAECMFSCFSEFKSFFVAAKRLNAVNLVNNVSPRFKRCLYFKCRKAVWKKLKACLRKSGSVQL